MCSALNKKLVLSVAGKKSAASMAAKLAKRTNVSRQIFDFVPAKAQKAAAGGQVVQDGTYLICLKAAPQTAVTIEASSKKANANAGLWGAGGVAGQPFKIAYDGAGFYTLTNVNSKRLLAVAKSCSVSGVNVVQRATTAGNAAKWRVEALAGGYRFVNKATGLALAAASTKGRDGANVRGWKPASTTKQIFSLIDASSVSPTFGGVYYVTTAKKQSLVLEPKGAKRRNDVKAVVHKKRTKNSNVQRYEMAPAGNGSYYIRNAVTKRVLSLAAESKKSGTSVVMSKDVGASFQQWRVVVNPDFTLGFKNAYSGLMLTVAGGKAANNAKLKVQKPTKALAAAQKFWLQNTQTASEKVTLGVPCYMQMPQLPTGCEAVALTNAIRYWGYSVSKTEIARNWMPRGEDGVYNFIGNPFDWDGWIICAPGITDTANDYLNSKGIPLNARNITGTTLAELREYLDQGYPVVIWITEGLMSPTDAEYRHGYPLRGNNHAVVLSGYDPATGDYLTADSIAGTKWRDGDKLGMRYRQMGRQAVVVSD